MVKTIAAKTARSKTKDRIVDELPVFRNGREFDALSEADKQRVSKYYDRPIRLSETRPLNAAERAQWERVTRKSGRPTKGEGAKAVRVTIEGGLLRRADRYAEAAGFTRSQLIARGLEAILSGPTDRRRAQMRKSFLLRSRMRRAGSSGFFS